MIDPFVFQLAVLSLLGFILAAAITNGGDDDVGGLVSFCSFVPLVWMVVELVKLS